MTARIVSRINPGCSRSIWLHTSNVAARFARDVWQIGIALKHRRELKRLADLDDHMLADIGLNRSDLRDAASAPFWHDPTSILEQRAKARMAGAASGRPIESFQYILK